MNFAFWLAQGESATPSTASSNTSAPASMRADEPLSGQVSSFQTRLADAGSAPSGASPMAAALDGATLQPSPLLSPPRQPNECPVAATPGRQQHGFLASPAATQVQARVISALWEAFVFSQCVLMRSMGIQDFCKGGIVSDCLPQKACDCCIACHIVILSSGSGREKWGMTCGIGCAGLGG